MACLSPYLSCVDVISNTDREIATITMKNSRLKCRRSRFETPTKAEQLQPRLASCGPITRHRMLLLPSKPYWHFPVPSFNEARSWHICIWCRAICKYTSPRDWCSNEIPSRSATPCKSLVNQKQKLLCGLAGAWIGDCFAHITVKRTQSPVWMTRPLCVYIAVNSIATSLIDLCRKRAGSADDALVYRWLNFTPTWWRTSVKAPARRAKWSSAFKHGSGGI